MPRGRARITKRRNPGEMTKTEAAYAEFLEASRLRGEIASWRYEPITLRLTTKRNGIPALRYTPDFLVVTTEGYLDFHEVKPTWTSRPGQTESARNKLKLTAELFPEFGLYCVSPRRKKDGGGWLVETFSDKEPT